MVQDDLPAEVLVHVTNASSRTIPKPARDLVQAWRRFFMQRCLQRAVNLLRAAFRRCVPNTPDLKRSLHSNLGRESWMGAIKKAGDRELELIPRA